MTIDLDALKARLAEGVLAFPATGFDAEDRFDPDATERHVARLAGFAPSALVPAGGAGEVFSLTVSEQEQLVRATVRAAGSVPVVAGIGGGLGVAREMARGAERAGADGLLLLPPYLVSGEQAGLARYVGDICAATRLPVIVYSRDNAVLASATVIRLLDECPTLIGFKDGMADFETVLDLRHRAGERLVVINGVPTAEIMAAQYFAIGIRSYSSAVFAFFPELALAFHAAIAGDDRATSGRIMRDFYLPLTAIRRRRRGYAVAIIKAGLAVVGQPLGPVRSPLVDLSADEHREIAALIESMKPVVADLAQRSRA